MERIRTEILPGVWLTALRTDKFKTAWLSVNLLTQLRRSTAACTAVLPYVLRRGSTRLPDLETIAAELERLYGASITPSVPLSVIASDERTSGATCSSDEWGDVLIG